MTSEARVLRKYIEGHLSKIDFGIEKGAHNQAEVSL